LGGRERGAGVQLPATVPVPPPWRTGSGHRGGGGRVVGRPRARRGRATPSDGARAAAVPHRQRAPWWRGAHRWVAENAARACSTQRWRPCRSRGAQAAGTVVAGGASLGGRERGAGVQLPATAPVPPPWRTGGGHGGGGGPVRSRLRARHRRAAPSGTVPAHCCSAQRLPGCGLRSRAGWLERGGGDRCTYSREVLRGRRPRSTSAGKIASRLQRRTLKILLNQH